MHVRRGKPVDDGAFWYLDAVEEALCFGWIDSTTALKAARVWSKFRALPPLYQRVRAYNVAFYKTRNPAAYEKALSHLIDATRAGKLFGEWNDYGRLLEE